MASALSRDFSQRLRGVAQETGPRAGPAGRLRQLHAIDATSSAAMASTPAARHRRDLGIMCIYVTPSSTQRSA